MEENFAPHPWQVLLVGKQTEQRDPYGNIIVLNVMDARDELQSYLAGSSGLSRHGSVWMGPEGQHTHDELQTRL